MIKKVFNTEEKKRLLGNFFSLLILQGANYILPLITFPYLVRVLGVEKFGLLAFANATIVYFNILSDYGFNLTATREVSIYKDNKKKLNEIFSSVMTIKFFLMFISFILLLILVFSIEKFRTHYAIFLLTFGVVIGQVLFPQWLFQGMERMKYITFLNILAKVIFTIAIFIFVHKSSDYWKVPLVNSLGFISAGIIALLLIKKEFNIRFKIQNIRTVKNYLIDGWHVFISGIFTLAYTNSVPVILGFFTNNLIVGYYSIADKITKIVISLFSPIQTVIFPYISSLLKKSKEKTICILNKFLKITFIVMLLISSCLFILADKIIYIISGQYVVQSIIILKILSFLPLIISIARILSMDYIIIFKLEKYLTKIYLLSSIIGILIIIFCIYFFQGIGAAISVIIIETIVTILLFSIVKRKILYEK